jgi:putative transposase
MQALEELVAKHPTIGFWKCFFRLGRKGYGCNHKRLYRVYKLLRLNIHRRIKRRLPQRIKQPLVVPEIINQSWIIPY